MHALAMLHRALRASCPQIHAKRLTSLLAAVEANQCAQVASLKHARAQREPWLLAVCPGLAHLSAQAVVAVYAQRMQIEEVFRDLKNERLGLGLSANRCKSKARDAAIAGHLRMPFGRSGCCLLCYEEE